MFASDHYEWQDTPNGTQPDHFTRRDGAAATIAGLRDEWANPKTCRLFLSGKMVITGPNKFGKVELAQQDQR